ncbi:MAG: hypothetical protein E4H36_05640 [Spirochaetales bacterium]|nr:MAG: hypothetical protein E4H36_05640 [Spirochaetales bacterium]
MTLTLRNSILIGFLLVVTLFFLFFSAFLIYLVAGFPRSFLLNDLYQITESTKPIAELLITCGAYILYSLVTGYVLKTYFRKTTSPEVFFFMLFTLSLSFNGLKCFQIFLILNSLPSYYGVVLTRLDIFGTFFGLGCLFCAGIFPTGIRTQKYGLFIGLIFLISVIIAASLPVDASTMDTSLSYAVGNKKELYIVLYVLKLFSFINFFLAGYFKNNRDYYYLGLAILVLLAGTEAFRIFSSHLLEISGFISLVFGTVFFSNRIHSLYMWR